MEKEVKLVAITGSIATGKSFVLDIFKELGVPTFSCDEELRKIMDNDEAVIKQVKEKFPEAVVVVKPLVSSRRKPGSSPLEQQKNYSNLDPGFRRDDTEPVDETQHDCQGKSLCNPVDAPNDENTAHHQQSSRGRKEAVAIHLSQMESQYGLPRVCCADPRNDGAPASDFHGNDGGKEKINRKILSDIIFNDAIRREELEAILYPKLYAVQNKFIKEHSKAEIIALEVPLLYEKEGADKYDAVIVTTVSEDIQQERAAKRGISREKLDTVLKNQLPSSVKESKADYVIDTHLENTVLQEQVRAIVSDIRSCN